MPCMCLNGLYARATDLLCLLTAESSQRQWRLAGQNKLIKCQIPTYNTLTYKMERVWFQGPSRMGVEKVIYRVRIRLKWTWMSEEVFISSSSIIGFICQIKTDRQLFKKFPSLIVAYSYCSTCSTFLILNLERIVLHKSVLWKKVPFSSFPSFFLSSFHSVCLFL